MASNGYVCQLDVTELDALFNKLNNKQVRNIIMCDSLQKGGEKLREQTLTELSARQPRLAASRYGDVPVVVDKNYCEVTVKIIGKRGKVDHRLKWFETGTNERYRKIRTKDVNGRTRRSDNPLGYTGRVEGVHFFQAARGDTQPIENAISQQFESTMKSLFM